jgi:hypothetical protein
MRNLLSGNCCCVTPIERLGNHGLYEHVNMVGDASFHTESTEEKL